MNQYAPMVVAVLLGAPLIWLAFTTPDNSKCPACGGADWVMVGVSGNPHNPRVDLECRLCFASSDAKKP